MADRLMRVYQLLGLRVPIASTLAGLLLTGVAAADSADPTRPPQGFSEQPGASAQIPQDAPLVVSSLFLMGNKPYAVVDGQIVRPGDPLAGGRVGKIDANGVWISVPAGGRTPSGMRQLKWLPDVVKQPVRARMEKK